MSTKKDLKSKKDDKGNIVFSLKKNPPPRKKSSKEEIPADGKPTIVATPVSKEPGKVIATKPVIKATPVSNSKKKETKKPTIVASPQNEEPQKLRLESINTDTTGKTVIIATPLSEEPGSDEVAVVLYGNNDNDGKPVIIATPITKGELDTDSKKPTREETDADLRSIEEETDAYLRSIEVDPDKLKKDKVSIPKEEDDNNVPVCRPPVILTAGDKKPDYPTINDDDGKYNGDARYDGSDRNPSPLPTFDPEKPIDLFEGEKADARRASAEKAKRAATRAKAAKEAAERKEDETSSVFITDGYGKPLKKPFNWKKLLGWLAFILLLLLLLFGLKRCFGGKDSPSKTEGNKAVPVTPTQPKKPAEPKKVVAPVVKPCKTCKTCTPAKVCQKAKPCKTCPPKKVEPKKVEAKKVPPKTTQKRKRRRKSKGYLTVETFDKNGELISRELVPRID